MKAIPAHRVGRKRTIKVPMPKPVRTEDDSILRNSVGAPILLSGAAEHFDEDQYALGAKVRFGRELIISRESGLGRAALAVITVLVEYCPYAESAIVYDEDTGEPIEAGPGYALAVLSRAGNETKAFSISDLADQIGYSARTVRDALNDLEGRKLIRPIDVDLSTQTKKVKSNGGRPIKLRRYEINPLYAYSGSYSDSMGVVTHTDEHDPF